MAILSRQYRSFVPDTQAYNIRRNWLDYIRNEHITAALVREKTQEAVNMLKRIYTQYSELELITFLREG